MKKNYESKSGPGCYKILFVDNVLTFIHQVGLLANLASNLAPPVIDLGNFFEILYQSGETQIVCTVITDFEG